MKCTGKEWDTCRVEKMGCKGCYYNERIKVEFSKNGEGKVLMTAVGNTLYLDNIKRKTKLGDTTNLDDKDLEKIVQLNFYKVESIDILIEKLIAIKNNIILESAS